MKYVSPVHPLKAVVPIVVIPFGHVNDVNVVIPANADAAMDVIVVDAIVVGITATPLPVPIAHP